MLTVNSIANQHDLYRPATAVDDLLACLYPS